MMRFACFFLLFLASYIWGGEPYSPESKKYEFSVCAVFKNEAKYLKEWIEYHHLIGVDHFYLYNIGSRDDYLRILRPFIRENLVTLIQWPDLSLNTKENKQEIWVLGSQIPAYENAIKVRAYHESKWLAFLDVDEFLVPPYANCDLKDLLEKYDAFPAIVLVSDYFNAGYERAPNKLQLIIESTERTSPPAFTFSKAVEKTIFKPQKTESFYWPPYRFVFKNQESAIVIDKQEIRVNQYLNRGQKQIASNRKSFEDLDKTIHYYVPEVRKRLGFDLLGNP